jgi:polysaccharide biosynthesis protein PslH
MTGIGAAAFSAARQQPGEYERMDEQLAISEGKPWNLGQTLSAATERNRVVCVFDEHYSARGSVVYGAVHLLTAQLGDSASYDVFCQGAYRGPKFARAVKVTEGQRYQGLPMVIKRGARRLRRLAARLAVSESPSRWASNLKPGEEKLLPLLFDADGIRAVVVFTADADFALRISRLAHIYSSTDTPHLIVVTPDDRMSQRTMIDLNWLGVRLLRDGDLVVVRSQTAEPPDSDELYAKLAAPLFSFLSPQEYPRPFTDHHNQINWLTWMDRDRPYPKRVSDVVLFVRPDWTNCGSGTAFENLARWFRERDSLLIDVGIWPFGDNFNPISRNVRVDSEQNHIRAALYFSARRSTSMLHAVRQAGLLLRWFPWTVARQKLLQHALAAKPHFLRQAIHRAKISHIYVNHYFTYGYAREFIADHPFFLDTHDIQTVNFIHHDQRNLITGRADRFDASLRDEMEIAAKAKRLCFYSEEELDLAARYVDRARLGYVLPLPRVDVCTPQSLRTPANLLIVASDNPANIRGLNWFLTQVWPLVVDLSGDHPLPALRICGNIDAAMTLVKIPGVTFVGVVPKLWEYYDDADLVLLPIISGGGVAIKTLEAVLHERPVLATRHALRGLPDDVVQTIGHNDDPVEYATSLVAIITDQARHQEQLALSLQAATMLKAHSFQLTLGKAMDAVRLSGPLVTDAPAVDPQRSDAIVA